MNQRTENFVVGTGFLAAIALLLCAVAFAGDTIPLKKPAQIAQIAKDDLSGLWEAHGVEDSDGEPKSYTAVVMVKKHGEGYVVQWTAGPGANTVGIGTRETRDGDDDRFIVSWQSKGMMGLSIYTIGKSGKEMSGRWMALPGAKWASESLKFVAPLPVPKKLIST